MAIGKQLGERRASGGVLARLGRDYAYVLPGFFLSLASFIALVPLFSLGVGTAVMWVGAVILPFTLVIAGWFADLSRVRLRSWGAGFEPVNYRPRREGLMGFIKAMADPRRWLDLLFEGLIALPLRTFTFSVAVSWSAVALGGPTYWFWGAFIPDGDGLLNLILEAIYGEQVPAAFGSPFILDVIFYLVLGIIALVTLPLVMRGLANLDALVARAALLGPEGPPVSRRSVAPSADGGPADRAPDSDADRNPGKPTSEQISGAEDGRITDRVKSWTDERGVSAAVSAEGWSWLASAIVAIATFAINWPLLSVIYGVHPAIALALTAAHAGAVLLTVRTPQFAIALNALVVFSTAVFTMETVGSPWPWPVMTMILHFAVLLIVALRNSWRWGLAAWLSGLLVTGLVLGVFSLAGTGGFAGALTNSIVAVAVGLGVTVIAVGTRALAVSRGQLASERELTNEELEKRKELEERNRIAGELHDVVAHSMSVIGVQATTAKYRIDGMDERVAEEFDSIAGSSRRALAEMRGLLTLLRTGESAELAPQPEFADVTSLIESSSQSGATIELSVGGEAANDASLSPVVSALPSATGLTAYRAVQEGLSNALRHSPGAAIKVELELEEDELSIRVVNGPASDAQNAQAVGSGLGLPGIRSRVEALGGMVRAGSVDDGGYELSVRLPLG